MSSPVESPSAETSPSSNRSRNPNRPSHASHSSERVTPTYGFHNTFHTHEQPALDTPPPSYAHALDSRTQRRFHEKACSERAPIALPSYTCTVEIGSVLGMKQELSTPFEVASNREWFDVYAILQGTQLSIFRMKTPNILSKTRSSGPGRLIRTYTLQHAEVGVAADFKKTPLTPKSPFAHLVPASARQKLFESDPHLFEPIREHVLRLRLETEQFLLCASSQEEMLEWIEKLCAAVDISPPLDDRSEPRYRSLPRRTRRQRQLDGVRLSANMENLANVDAGRRLIAEQEQIIRQLYPHLAAGPQRVQEAQEQVNAPTPSADPETDDLDPEDVRFPTARRTALRNGESDDRPASSSTAESSGDPKSCPPHQHTPAQALRYRRRCAPILLACSPRVSDVVFSGGARMRINVKEHTLVEYTSHPPRYDVHSFPKTTKPPASNPDTAAPKALPANIRTERPSLPARANSEDSIMSFGSDLVLASTSSQSSTHIVDDNEIRFVPASEPPSPTTASHAKVLPTQKPAALGKTRTSEKNVRDKSLTAVAMGVGLLL